MQSAGRFAIRLNKTVKKWLKKQRKVLQIQNIYTDTQIKSYLLDFHFLYSPIHFIPRHKSFPTLLILKYTRANLSVILNFQNTPHLY